jgi:HlyD family secretion protein
MIVAILYAGGSVDRVIRKKPFTLKKTLIVLGLLLSLALIGLLLPKLNFHKTGKVKLSQISISTVMEKSLASEIQTIGTIEPDKSIIIESDEAGKIAEIYRSSGSSLFEGTPILRLENRTLVQEIKRFEELKKEEELLLALNREEAQSRALEFSDQLLELNYSLQKLERELEIDSRLLKSGAVSQESVAAVRQEFEYMKKKLGIYLAKRESDLAVESAREELQNRKILSVENNLVLLRGRRDLLTICSPVSGVLSLEDIEIGRNIGAGEPVGSIAREGSFKMTASVDEFYLPRISPGDHAYFQEGKAELSFISPIIRDGVVNLEFVLLAPVSENLLSGRTYNLSIRQGEPSIKMVVSNGGFYSDTAGNWVFKVRGREAMRVPVSTGLKNREWIEITSGLEVGDRIIVSTYSPFMDCDRIVLDEEI